MVNFQYAFKILGYPCLYVPLGNRNLVPCLTTVVENQSQLSKMIPSHPRPYTSLREWAQKNDRFSDSSTS